MEQKKKVILLAGPTASGKSSLALKLATRLNGEIINADSMQIYREFSILTSRPNSKDTFQAKHHLYGIKSVTQEFSTGHWLKLATKKIKELLNKKKTPIIVGGTGLYFKALIDGLVKIPEIPKKVKTNTRKIHKKIGQIKFYQKLIKLDPLSKDYISPNDSQRSIRAFEVKKFTKKSLFLYRKNTKIIFDKNTFIKIFINIPRDELKEKIYKRTNNMFKQDVILEVKKFLKMKIDNEMSANKIIGIKEIEDFNKNKMTLDQLKELINIKTRQYAKRQFTWSRGHMSSWDMIYSKNLNDLLKKTINKIS